MATYHHKPIRKFSLNGIINDESGIGRLRQEYVRLLTSEMRLCGYVPRLDIDIDFTLDYNEKKQYFEFEISVYGIFTGRKQSQWIQGIDGTKAIITQESKLKEFSQVRE